MVESETSLKEGSEQSEEDILLKLKKDPYMEKISRFKFYEDLKNTCIQHPFPNNKESQQKTINELVGIGAVNLKERTTNFDVGKLNQNIWNPIINKKKFFDSINLKLADYGSNYLIKCPAIFVSSCIVLKLMQEYIPNLQVVIGSPTARELVRNLEQEFDFIVSSDAPMFLQRNRLGNLNCYYRAFAIHKQKQVIFKKKGKSKDRKPDIFLYPNSTALQQLKLGYNSPNKSIISDSTSYGKERMISIDDYPFIHKMMEPGDMLFVWEPHIQCIKDNRDKYLKKVKKSKFLFVVSMFYHPKLNIDVVALISEAFIHTWNRLEYSSNLFKEERLLKLMNDEQFKVNFGVSSSRFSDPFNTR